MKGELIVLEPEEFEHWLASGTTPQTLAAQGSALFRSLGCSGCHSPSATVHAPPLEGLFGRSVSLASGGTTFADETYLRDSILLPSRDITAGYPAVMPSFQGRVSEDQILALIAYIESLRDVREVPR
jgi:cytochrome c oxidase subunit 2